MSGWNNYWLLLIGITRAQVPPVRGAHRSSRTPRRRRECSKEHYHRTIERTSNAQRGRRESPVAPHPRVTSVDPLPGPSGSLSRRPVQAQQATLAARRYFIDGWTIKQIAAELDVSRLQSGPVARLGSGRGDRQDRDREHGPERCGPERRPAEHVRPAGCGGCRRARRLLQAVGPELAEMAALVVAEMVTPSDVVGVSWGRTLDLVAERLTSFHANSVVQLVGGFATLESVVRWDRARTAVSGQGEHDGVTRSWRPSGCEIPAADALRQDPMISKTLGLMAQVTVVLAGVGSWGYPPRAWMIECFDEDEVAALRAGGVVADLCGFLFNAQGEVLEQPENERIGVSLGQLEAAGTVLAICGGRTSAPPLGRHCGRASWTSLLLTPALPASYWELRGS